MVTVGEKIKEYRKSVKINQTKLAEKAEISRTYLSDVENNRYKPSISLLRKISEALAGAGGVIKIGNTTHINNTASLDSVIYNSLMEAAGYIKEADFLKTQLNALENEHMILNTEYQMIQHELSRSDLSDTVRTNLSEKLNKIETELHKLSVVMNSLKMNKELNKNFSGWDVLEDIPMDDVQDYLKKVGFKITETIQPKIDLETILNSTQEITFNGKTLNDKEKQKVLQVLHITLEN
ncbi:helix-turn-helix transcriptional regulator [Solibacillus sp. FSL W8-0474]|uniref:helix-turn-helix domain-containing protein n=1 Tax=Solibacillus sp. FSL W8-0474 TaxID=2975336 RepID=UPI0030F92201